MKVKINVKTVAASTLLALAGLALTAVVAANPFSTQASDDRAPEPTRPDVVERLQAAGAEDAKTRPYIGVVIGSLHPDEAQELGIDGGAVVKKVLDDGPSSGILQKGDVITSVDGQPVTDQKDVIIAVKKSTVGDALSLSLVRDGEPHEVTITVGGKAHTYHPGKKRHGFKKKPGPGRHLLQQALRAGDRFARSELVMADKNGDFRTFRAAAGAVTELDADAGTFTLQPRDGSAPIIYSVSQDTKVNLNRKGDLGALNTTDATLVLDVDGAVKLVHQGELPDPKKKGRWHGKKVRHHLYPGIDDPKRSGIRLEIRERLSGFDGGDPDDLMKDILPPGVLERLEKFEHGGPGHNRILREICDELDLTDLPDTISIRCETWDDAAPSPGVDDDTM